MILRNFIIGEKVVIDHPSFQPSVIGIADAINIYLSDGERAILNPPAIPLNLAFLATWINSDLNDRGEYKVLARVRKNAWTEILFTTQISWDGETSGSVVRRHYSRGNLRSIPFHGSGDYTIELYVDDNPEPAGKYSLTITLLGAPPAGKQLESMS